MLKCRQEEIDVIKLGALKMILTWRDSSVLQLQ